MVSACNTTHDEEEQVLFIVPNENKPMQPKRYLEEPHPSFLPPHPFKWYNWIKLQFYLADQDTITRSTGPPNYKEVCVLATICMSFWFLDYFPAKQLCPEAWVKAMGFPSDFQIHGAHEFQRHVAWLLMPIFTIIVILREPLSNYGLTLKGLRAHFPYYVVMMIFVQVGIRILARGEAWRANYPYWKVIGN